MTIAILGCGSIGARHAANLVALGRSDVLAYDPEPASRERLAERAAVRVVADIDEVWAAKPTIAIIATPTDKHLPLALAAARRGCHLFVEKPLSHRMDGVAELSRLVEANGLITLVACNMRFHPGPALLKQLLDEKVV